MGWRRFRNLLAALPATSPWWPRPPARKPPAPVAPPSATTTDLQNFLNQMGV